MLTNTPESETGGLSVIAKSIALNALPVIIVPWLLQTGRRDDYLFLEILAIGLMLLLGAAMWLTVVVSIIEQDKTKVIVNTSPFPTLCTLISAIASLLYIYALSNLGAWGWAIFSGTPWLAFDLAVLRVLGGKHA